MEIPTRSIRGLFFPIYPDVVGVLGTIELHVTGTITRVDKVIQAPEALLINKRK